MCRELWRDDMLFLWQVPEAGEVLRGQDGVLLLVQADYDKGKGIEETLRVLWQLEISVDAIVLADADDRLIRHYTGILSRVCAGAHGIKEQGA